MTIPVENIRLYLFNGWQIALMAIAMVFVLVFFWQRRRWRGILAVVSILLAIFTAIMLIISWNTLWVWGLGWNEQSYIMLNSSRGSLRARANVKADAKKLDWSGIVTVTHVPNRVDSLLFGKHLSLLSGIPFIEDKLGFQIAYAHIPGGTSYLFAVTAPHWMILSLTPWFPILWLRYYLRKHRQRGFPLVEPSTGTGQTPPAPPSSTGK
jgi:hypothetical protein